MIRKIVRHGPSTLTVSLPAKWVKKNELKKGDEINISEEGNKITISTEKESGKKSVEVDVTGLSRSTIMFYIRSLYRQGYDEILVKFKNEKTIYHDTGREIKVISIIHQEVNRLIGLEVVQQREDFCALKDLSGVSQDELDSSTKRIFYLLKDAFNDVVIAIKEKKYSRLETIEEKHDTITKFISYCLRILNKRPQESIKHANGMYHALCSLDTTTDMLKYFSRDVRLEKIDFSNESIKLLESFLKLLSITREIFFDKNMNKIKSFMELRSNVKKRITALKSEETKLMYYLTPNIEIMRDLIETKLSITSPE